MTPRALLVTGVSILVLGLLVLAIDTDTATDAPLALVQGYLALVCVVVGCALVILSAALSALRRRPKPPPPSIDHYS